MLTRAGGPGAESEPLTGLGQRGVKVGCKALIAVSHSVSGGDGLSSYASHAPHLDSYTRLDGGRSHLAPA